MSYYDYTFEGEIVNHDVGYIYTVIFLPEHLIGELPLDKYPRLRIEGEVAEQPFEGAWQPVRGRWYVMLSKDLLKAAEVMLGDIVEMRFRVVDQNTVDIPAELQQVINFRDNISEVWETLTPGKQRGFAHHISSAKTLPTRQKRLHQVIRALEEGLSLRDL
ncbi:MAG: YdeI/OmpD-associated family protein [Deinococcota bacterium]